MNLIEMTATFGKLERETLRLGPGLNIIEAPNEGGKSTWCAFLRAMLYGIPTRERDRQDFLAEKNRYQPWSGAAMEGELIVEWQGRKITLRRGQKGSTPFGSFSAVYTESGESVPGLTGDNCGELLLGVTRAVFERSAFVGQGSAAIGESAELEKRVAALASSGEEDVSYSQVEGTLKEWLRRRKYNKSGLIPKLENELEVLRDTLSRQERAQTQVRRAGEELSELTARQGELKGQLTAWRGQENQARLTRYQAAEAALDAARREVTALEGETALLPGRETLRAAQGELAYLATLEANRKLAEGNIAEAEEMAEAARQAAIDPYFGTQTPEEAWRTASEDCAAAQTLERSAQRLPRTSWIGALVGLGLGGALALCGVFFAHGSPLILALCGVGLFVAATLATYFVLRRRAGVKRGQAAALLARYGAQFPEDITQRAEDYKSRWVSAREAEQNAERVREEMDRLAAERTQRKSALLELVHTFAPEVKETFGISAALSRSLGLEERLSTARVRLEGAQNLLGSMERPQESPTAETVALPEGETGESLTEHISAIEGELSRVRSTMAMAQGELNTLGESTLFEKRKGELEEELDRRREEYAALTLALEGMERANAALRERFSPAVNREAGRILAALTGGKYETVTVGRDFRAMAGEKGSLLPRRTLELSQGTAEQVYLAVRLAVCRLALGDDVPLVLDDALDPFDDSRMALALEFLAGEGQTLLFTCHSREGRYGAAREIPVTALHSGANAGIIR